MNLNRAYLAGVALKSMTRAAGLVGSLCHRANMGSRARRGKADIEQYPQCGGTLTIIAAIEHPTVIAKILAHLGLSARIHGPELGPENFTSLCNAQ